MSTWLFSLNFEPSLPWALWFATFGPFCFILGNSIFFRSPRAQFWQFCSEWPRPSYLGYLISYRALVLMLWKLFPSPVIPWRFLAHGSLGLWPEPPKTCFVWVESSEIRVRKDLKTCMDSVPHHFVWVSAELLHLRAFCHQFWILSIFGRRLASPSILEFCLQTPWYFVPPLPSEIQGSSLRLKKALT